MRDPVSALTWLANKRARLSDELCRTERIASDVNAKLTKMRLDLAGIDRVIKVFDSRLDPSKIVGTRSNRLPGQRGVLRSTILEVLNEAAPEWIGTDVVETLVVARLGIAFETPAVRRRWYLNVLRRQLKRFVSQGIVERVEPPSDEPPVELGRWRLCLKQIPDLASLAHDSEN